MVAVPQKKASFGASSSTSDAKFGFFLLCVYTALVLIRPHEWPVLNVQFPLLRIVLIITFFAYLVSLRPKAWNVQCTILILMFFSMLLSEVRASRYFNDLGYVIDWINANIIPFILFLGFLTSFGRQKVILFISLVACVIMSQHAYVQISSPFGEGWAETVIYRNDGPNQMAQARYIGVFNDPNDMGMFLVMNIPIAIFFMVNTQRFLMKLMWLAVAGVLVMGIYWTGSRGSLVGVMAVLFSFFYLRFGRVKSLVLASLSVPGVIIVMSSFRTISKDDESAMQRLTAWYEGIQMLLHRPLFGFGKERFLEYHYKVAHNSFVTVMAELGVVGYMLWMTFVLLCMIMLLKVINLKKTEHAKDPKLSREISLAIFLQVSLIGFCSTAFFISRSYVIFFYIFAAMTAACFIRVSKQYPDLGLSISNKEIAQTFVLSLMSLIGLYLIIIFLMRL